MKIQLGTEDMPMLLYPHEMEMIIDNQYRREMLCIYMYFQMLKLKGVSNCTTKILTALFGSKYKEAIDELIKLGMVKEICITGMQEITDSDDLLTSMYETQHVYPNQVIQKEIIREQKVEVIPKKSGRPAFVTNIPEEAFKMADNWIFYIRERFQLDGSMKRYSYAKEFQRQLSLIPDDAISVERTLDWYIVNYKKHKFLPFLDNIRGLNYKYAKIKEYMTSTLQNRGVNAVI